MRFVVVAAALALQVLLSAAPAVAAKAPLVLRESYADKFVKEPGFGFDTVSVIRTKATFVVPFDPVFVGEENEETVLAFTLGDQFFDEFLGSAEKWVPGRSARWTVLDDFTGMPYLKVKATWRNGVLKVVAKGKNEDGAYSYWYSGETDLLIDGDPLDADLTFGRAEYYFEGALSGRADTSEKKKGGDEFDVSKVRLSGEAALVEVPEDVDPPWLDILDPWDEDELDLPETEVLWEAEDETSLAVLEYRVNGGEWLPIDFEVVIDPDWGDASAEGSFTIATASTGDYTLEVRAVDAFGNETRMSVSFSVLLE